MMSIKNRILRHSNQYEYYKNQTKNLNVKINELENEINKLKNEKTKAENEFLDDAIREKYVDGISVIIPSYKGADHIDCLLNSLEKQTLDSDKYDLIFIINGELDSTIEKIRDFKNRNPEKNVIMNFSSIGNVSNARNIGLTVARRNYVTFIDDDDFISPNYLKMIYKYSAPNRITMTNFMDYNLKEKKELESRVVPFSLDKKGIIENAYFDFPSLNSITVAKSVPTHAAKSIKFNFNLKNGVDISYFTRLYSKFDFEFYFIDKSEEAIYYRVLRGNSVSRQEYSYDFNVLQKLQVMDDINFAMKYATNEKDMEFLKLRMDATCGFIVKYLRKYPKDKQKVIDEINKHNFIYFSFLRINAIKDNEYED